MRVRLFVVIPLLMCLYSCVIKPKGEITVTTDYVDDITAFTAKSGGNVSFTGGFVIGDCGICYGEYYEPDLSDNYTVDSYGVGSFTSSMTGLKPGTLYYARAYAKTSSGIKYGQSRSFHTQSGDWLYYGDGSYNNSWGFTRGGEEEEEWAVRFPTTKLAPYAGTYVTKFRIYYKKEGVYPLKVYQGGYTSPTKTILSKRYQIDKTGWVTITNFDPFLLNTKQSMWVSVGFSYEAGEYPMCASAGINEPDARWSLTGSKWHDFYDLNDNRDLCWMIQVFLSYTGTKTGEEIVLGWQELSGEDNDEPSNDESIVVNSSDGKESILNSCQVDCE